MLSLRQVWKLGSRQIPTRLGKTPAFSKYLPLFYANNVFRSNYGGFNCTKSAFSTCSTFIGWYDTIKGLSSLSKTHNISLFDIEKNILRLDADSSSSALEQYYSKYSDIFKLITDIPKVKFLDEVLRDDADFDNRDELDTILSLYLLNEKHLRQSIDHTDIDLAFYIMSVGVLKNADSAKKTALQYVEEKVSKLTKDYKYGKERTQGEIGYLKWSILDYFFTNKKYWEPSTVTILNFVNNLIQQDPIYRGDISFLYTLTRRISSQTQKRSPTYSTQLLPHETPFENLIPKATKLDEGTTINQDAKENLLQEISKHMIEQIRNPKALSSLPDLNKCLDILLNNSNFKLFSIYEDIDKKREILMNKAVYEQKDMIEYINLLVRSPDYYESHTMEILRRDLVNVFYKALYSMELEKSEMHTLYSVFRSTQSVHVELLRKMEAHLLKNGKFKNLTAGEFFNIFYFYSSLPESIERGLSRNDIITYLKKHETSLETLLDIAIASIYYGYEGRKVSTLAELPVLDGELWNRILEALLSSKPEKLSVREKMKLFRTMKFLSFILEGEVFNNKLIQEKMAGLQKELEKMYDTIESEFQKEVETFIKERSYQKEALIEGIFPVDFLISKKNVLEVNGPQHYYLVYENFELKYLENRSTSLKKEMLSNLGYKVYSIPFYEWMKFEKDSEKRSYVVNLLKK